MIDPNELKTLQGALENLALVNLPSSMVSHYWPALDINQETVVCLRSCLLKPEHLEWIDEIGAMLEDVAG